MTKLGNIQLFLFCIDWVFSSKKRALKPQMSAICDNFECYNSASLIRTFLDRYCFPFLPHPPRPASIFLWRWSVNNARHSPPPSVGNLLERNKFTCTLFMYVRGSMLLSEHAHEHVLKLEFLRSKTHTYEHTQAPQVESCPEINHLS